MAPRLCCPPASAEEVAHEIEAAGGEAIVIGANMGKASMAADGRGPLHLGVLRGSKAFLALLALYPHPFSCCWGSPPAGSVPTLVLRFNPALPARPWTHRLLACLCLPASLTQPTPIPRHRPAAGGH